AGEKLPLTQADVKRDGWAIECRINAEDPFRNFLPSTGRLVRFQPPVTNLHQAEETLQGAAYAEGNFGGVRVDTGVVDGGEIPMFYDSMIAKLIVHGKDRTEAIAKMREALNGFVIRGVSSNIPFQAALLAHPRFVSGQFNTGFIAEQYAHGFKAEDVPHSDPNFLVALAAFTRCQIRERAAHMSGQLPGYGVKLGSRYTVVVVGATGTTQHVPVDVVEFSGHSGFASININGEIYDIESSSRMNEVRIAGLVNGAPFTAQIERGTAKSPLAFVVQHNGTKIEALVMAPNVAELFKLMPFKAPPDMSKYVLSPMPGLLVDVAVQPGQKVQAGERVAVIEAMKMENVLFAAADGVVGKVLAVKGDSLSVDQPIVDFVG
ncbi:MAG: acetyl/propionyl-CoA carboxylase subunit alpha, partial [Burkholderiales bacterium]|nr:acetyl/propionyl-CoA carboxylase subunit alpha [Burkholderiales bacterium]